MSASVDTSRRGLLLAALATLPLAACGFRLQGIRDLPFQTLYVNAPRGQAELVDQIRLAVVTQSSTQIADQPSAAEVILDILENRFEKVILSLNSAGRVREYQLRQKVSFLVRTQDHTELMPRTTIEIRRDLTYSDAELLAKQQEELTLQGEMRSDLVQQLLRRLQALKRPQAS